MLINNSKKSYLLALLTAVLWSTAASAFKIGLQFSKPPMLLFVSSFISLIFFLCLIYFKNLNFKDIFKISNLSKSMLAGLLNPFLYYLILFKAYSLLPAQIAQPLNYTWVLVVTVLMSVFLKKKINKIGLTGLLISFTGVILISMQNKIPGLGNISFLGVILALSSSVFWGVYWLINIFDKRNDLEKLFLNFLFGTIYIFIYILFFDQLKFSMGGILSGIYVGLLEMGLTFYIWLNALKFSTDITKTGAIIYISPFLSFIFITLILKEPLNFIPIAGLFLINFGIIFQNYFHKIFPKKIK